MRDDSVAPLSSRHRPDFAYAPAARRRSPAGLQGNAGYSRKIGARNRASYYFSQPYFKPPAASPIDGQAGGGHRQAWMDREWSSQPLASDQTGWDWCALHLNSGEKLMLYRLRQKDAITIFRN